MLLHDGLIQIDSARSFAANRFESESFFSDEESTKDALHRFAKNLSNLLSFTFLNKTR